MCNTTLKHQQAGRELGCNKMVTIIRVVGGEVRLLRCQHLSPSPPLRADTHFMVGLPRERQGESMTHHHRWLRLTTHIPQIPLSLLLLLFSRCMVFRGFFPMRISAELSIKYSSCYYCFKARVMGGGGGLHVSLFKYSNSFIFIASSSSRGLLFLSLMVRPLHCREEEGGSVAVMLGEKKCNKI